MNSIYLTPSFVFISDSNSTYTYRHSVGCWMSEPFDPRLGRLMMSTKDVPEHILEKVPNVLRLLFFDL